MSNNNLTTEQQNLKNLSAVISHEKTDKYLDSVLGERKNVFVTSVLSLAQSNTDLANCDSGELMRTCMMAASLNLPLSPGLGQAWVIPYNNKKKGITVPQFQIGDKGYIQLALRTDKYARLNVAAFKKSQVKFNKLTEELEVLCDEEFDDPNEYDFFVAYFELKNGFKKYEIATKEQILKHADRFAQSFSLEKYEQLKAGKVPDKEKWKLSSPWYHEDDFLAMARKTLIKRILRNWGPLSTELVQAFETDKADGTDPGGFGSTKLEAEYKEKRSELLKDDDLDSAIEQAKKDIPEEKETGSNDLDQAQKEFQEVANELAELRKCDVIDIFNDFNIGASSSVEDINLAINSIKMELEG